MMATGHGTVKEEHDMDAKELQAWKRVAKKLSALRQTLRKEERKILDRMILGESSEVEMHALTPRIEPRVTPQAEPRVTPRVEPRVTPRMDLRITLDASGEYSITEAHVP